MRGERTGTVAARRARAAGGTRGIARVTTVQVAATTAAASATATGVVRADRCRKRRWFSTTDGYGDGDD